MSETNQPEQFNRFIFLFYWIGAHILVSIARGFVHILFTDPSKRSIVISPLVFTLIYIVFTFILLVIQMLILKPHMQKAHLWVRYSLGVLPVTSIMVWISQNLIVRLGLVELGLGVGSAILIGLAQMFILRQSFAGAGWWPFLQGISAFIGQLIYVIYSVFGVVNYTFSSNLMIYVYPELPATLAVSLITGSVLARFIRVRNVMRA